MALRQVRRNQNGEITQVEAPNGKPSILFSSINKFVKNKEQALQFWSNVYKPSFKSWFGDWQNNSSPKNVITQSELLTLQSQILNTNGDINYKELKKACDTVINGQAYINTLSLGEETGRTKGGRRNVEASLIATTNERANYKKQTDVKRTEQEKLLEEYAKETGRWIDTKEFPESEILGEGAEAKLFKSAKEGHIRKVVNYRKFSKTPLEYLTNRVSLHNYLFPDTAYELVGFTTTEDFTGNQQFAFVIEQPYVTGRYLDYSKEAHQFRTEIKKLGFNVELENFRPKLFNESYIVRDLHAENVLFTDKGSYLFIDTVPVLNTDDGLRHYGDGLLTLRDSDTQNLFERLDENGEPLVQYVYPPASDNI